MIVNGSLRAQPFIDITQMVRAAASRACCPSPSIPHTRRTTASSSTSTTRPATCACYEFRSATGRSALPSTPRQSLLRVAHRQFDNHDGGQLQFGPDGLLYVGDRRRRLGRRPAQPRAEPRLPAGQAAAPERQQGRCEVAASRGYGLRNPWRFSWDRLPTRDLYIGDVGQNEWEEGRRARTPRQQRYLSSTTAGGSGRAPGALHLGAEDESRGRLVFPIVTYKHWLAAAARVDAAATCTTARPNRHARSLLLRRLLHRRDLEPARGARQRRASSGKEGF